MRIKSWLTLATVSAAFLATSLLMAGPARAVDKDEVQQKNNPVKEMHEDILKQKELEKNAPQWYTYEDALVKARKEGKFVMVDFYATWCKWCKKLEKETYVDPRVAEAIKADFVPVKIDAESSKAVIHEMHQMTMTELADLFGVKSYPAIWFLDKDGVKADMLNGYLPPEDFLKYLAYIKSGAYKNMKFDEYVTKGGKS